MTRGESKTSPRRLVAMDRQVQALRLRARGLTYGQIATALGYASRRGPHNAISRMVRQRPALDEVDLLLDLERVDGLFRTMYARALSGNLEAIAGCLALMEQRAHLLANLPRAQ
jgi:hypothetical protein